VRYLPGASLNPVLSSTGIAVLNYFIPFQLARRRRDFHKRENKVGFTWEWYLLELMFSPQTFPVSETVCTAGVPTQALSRG